MKEVKTKLLDTKVLFDNEFSQICEIGPILKIYIKEGTELEPPHVRYIHDLIAPYAAKNDLFLMLCFHPTVMASREARTEFGLMKRAYEKNAEALVIEPLAHRLFVNFHLRVYKPSHPIKVFNDEKNAINWLLSLLP